MQGNKICPHTRRFGVFEVDLRAAELRKRGVRIKLQEQPFRILSLLLERPGEVVTREELRETLWPAHTFVDFDRSLNKAMTKLRCALADSPESPRYVETVPRHGYRFLASVHTGHDDQAGRNWPAGPDEIPMDGSGTNTASGNGAAPLKLLAMRRRMRLRRLYMVAAALLLGLAATSAYLRFHPLTVWGGSSFVPGPRRSVAVIGFKNLSGNPQEAWLSTALSDWLMTELTAGEQVRMIPAENIARMKMELSLPDVDSLSRESLERIRKNLGTDFVVVGAYAMVGGKSDGEIRLDLRLQDTQSGEIADAISEKGTESHLLELVSRAGEHLRQRLGVRAVTREEAAEVAVALPSRGETAKLYSEGLAKLRVFDALDARDLLRRAVASEPDYAPSHAALARAWSQLGYDENAKSEAKKAFDLSSSLPRAERLLVEGRYREMTRDWARATEIYRALFDFFPDNLDYGLALASAQLGANKWKEALETTTALRTLPAPLRDNPEIDLLENDAAQALGDTKRAETALARAVEKAQSAGASLLLAKARREQAWLFENSGKQHDVEGVIREAKQLYIAASDRRGVAQTSTLEGIALERQGNYLEAKKRYDESLAIYRETGNKLSLSGEYDNLGDVLFYLGHLQEARKNYDQALSAYAEFGDQNGVSLVKLGLGDVALAEGKHQQAKQMYGEALAICRVLGNRSREASALEGLAKVERVEGDAVNARQNAAEAAAKKEEVGDRNEAAHVGLLLAQLALDEGKNTEAAATAQASLNVFEDGKAERYAAEANLILSRALLAGGQIDEARRKIERAMAMAKESHNSELEWSAAITAAQIEAAPGKRTQIAESMKRLETIVGEAARAGFPDLVFEARLTLGEIEMKGGNALTGRPALESVARDSTRAGDRLLSSRADAALKMLATHATD
jgi:DNA-binding winged helix-turn-helix (wHTH) protein/tetratricopeptide (TPR) repeat protein